MGPQDHTSQLSISRTLSSVMPKGIRSIPEMRVIAKNSGWGRIAWHLAGDTNMEKTKVTVTKRNTEESDNRCVQKEPWKPWGKCVSQLKIWVLESSRESKRKSAHLFPSFSRSETEANINKPNFFERALEKTDRMELIPFRPDSH